MGRNSAALLYWLLLGILGGHVSHAALSSTLSSYQNSLEGKCLNADGTVDSGWSDAFDLGEAAALCSKYPDDCTHLHDYNCDNAYWRACKGVQKVWDGTGDACVRAVLGGDLTCGQESYEWIHYSYISGLNPNPDPDQMP